MVTSCLTIKRVFFLRDAQPPGRHEKNLRNKAVRVTCYFRKCNNPVLSESIKQWLRAWTRDQRHILDEPNKILPCKEYYEIVLKNSIFSGNRREKFESSQVLYFILQKPNCLKIGYLLQVPFNESSVQNPTGNIYPLSS